VPVSELGTTLTMLRERDQDLSLEIHLGNWDVRGTIKRLCTISRIAVVGFMPKTSFLIRSGIFRHISTTRRTRISHTFWIVTLRSSKT